MKDGAGTNQDCGDHDEIIRHSKCAKDNQDQNLQMVILVAL